MSPIMVMDDTMVYLRCHIMYKNMLRKEYAKVKSLMINTLKRLDSVAVANEVSRDIYHKLHAARIQMAIRRYDCAHNYIRDIKYILDDRMTA